MDSMGRSSCPTCPHTWQEGPLEKTGVCWLPSPSFSYLLLLVMETALERAASFSTLVVSEDRNSLLKSVCFAEGKSSMPYLLHDRSLVSRIFDLRVDEMSSDAFPTRHRICCTRVRISFPSTIISWSTASPPSIRFFHSEVRG